MIDINIESTHNLAQFMYMCLLFETGYNEFFFLSLYNYFLNLFITIII